MGSKLEVIIFLCVIIALGLDLGCGAKSTTNSAVSGTPTPTPSPTTTPSPTPTPSSNFPFEVSITSQYDSTSGPAGPITQEVDCQMPTASVAGTISACNIAIPEGRLHFSTLTWTVSVGSQPLSPPCEIVVFQPYYYQASNTANFSPTWVTSPVDCSTSPISAACFSGVGTVIVPGFPQYTSIVYETTYASVNTFVARSANSQGRISNRWTVNNNSNVAGAQSFNGDHYLANTNVNYLFTCNDKYMQPVYTFTMVLTDQDITGGPNQPANPAVNQFPDWDPLGWGN